MASDQHNTTDRHFARNANGPLSELQHRHSTLKDTLGLRNPHVRNKAGMPISTRSSISPSPKSSQQKKAVKYILQSQRRKEPHDEATPAPTSGLNWRDDEVSEAHSWYIFQSKTLPARWKTAGTDTVTASVTLPSPAVVTDAPATGPPPGRG